MIVFGKPRRTERTENALSEVLTALSSSDSTRVLIEAGELAQGLIDHAFHVRGFDELGAIESGCGRLMLAAGRFFAEPASGPEDTREALRELRELSLPSAIDIRVPEGFAFYGVDPRLYLLAARREALSGGECGELRVIGIRSIGLTLGALVAVGLGASHFHSVRPIGDPFRRELRIGPRLRQELLEPKEGRAWPPRFAIVDEGPGLSGSSFLSVATWLNRNGTGLSRILLFPSHEGGPGPRASEEGRKLWSSVPKRRESFEACFAPDGLDLSAGNWRPLLQADPNRWPPAHPFFERRKYLVRERGRGWLLKFSGFGRYGRQALERATALAQAGLSPRVRGLRSGFLESEWIENARPVRLHDRQERSELLERAGLHLRFILKTFDGSDSPGSGPSAHLKMARHNLAGRFDEDFLGPFRDRVEEFEGAARPVRTDNRLHAWEWIRAPDGRIIKTDGLDHHCGHDLVGAQDIAWDLAGARVELALSDGEYDELLRSVFRNAPKRRPGPDRELFYLICYLAFQIGYFTEGATMTADAFPADSIRLGLKAVEYGSCFSRLRHSWR